MNKEDLIFEITMKVIERIFTSRISVEEIQDLVETELMKNCPEVAKKYIIYREWRNIEREKKTQMKQVMDGIVAIDKNDVNLNNANMSSYTPAGQMMTFASEITKDYTYKYLLPQKYAEAHRLGDIHIHDLDYYPTKTTTYIQYDLGELFENGFHTKNGSIRAPAKHTKLRYAGNYCFSDQSKRTTRWTVYPCIRLFHGKRSTQNLFETPDHFSGILHNHEPD
ncbi:Anaerobic ribonucleoside-triphosphate reductase [termite gut metagenome]|uniref:Anaerobic ribonucleoside-triphosphate reductase n=1 Tax=termite gut metagenome TaxID=433724 RepID=A0A5J4R7H7_9ZZZZ